MSEAPDSVSEGGAPPAVRRAGLLLGPALFLFVLWGPELAGDPLPATARRCLAVTVLTAVFWMTGAGPIPAVSLIPLAAMPLLGVMSASKMSALYSDQIIFLFLGGFFLALTIERWNLHRRIALHVVHLLGADARRIVLGFMLATGFISCWISNTATALLMLPIALAVLASLGTEGTPAGRSFGAALLIGIAHAASIGGMGTPIGTAPNAILLGIYRKHFPEAPELGFTTWITFGFPIVAALLPLSWLILTRVALRVPRDPGLGARAVIDEERRRLGPMSRGERLALGAFLVAALLWITRADADLGGARVAGWASRIGLKGMVEDSTVAIAVAVLLFFIPVDRKKGVMLLDWPTAVRVPWGMVLLLGSGIAIAGAFEESGLSAWIGRRFSGVTELPPVVVIGGIALAVTFLSEIMSNVALTTLLLPILAATASSAGLPPLLLMLPATLAGSCGFMLPVATPPNAIVFATGRIPMGTMMRAGFLVNLIGAVVIWLVLRSLGPW